MYRYEYIFTNIPHAFITISINKNAMTVYQKVNIHVTKAMSMICILSLDSLKQLVNISS